MKSIHVFICLFIYNLALSKILWLCLKCNSNGDSWESQSSVSTIELLDFPRWEIVPGIFNDLGSLVPVLEIPPYCDVFSNTAFVWHDHQHNFSAASTFLEF